MPLIQKQNSKPAVVAPKKSGSILDRAVPVTRTDRGGLNLSLYGRGKTGKTRLISSFPKPICILGVKDGTRSIQTVEGIDYFKIVLNAKDAPKTGNYVLLNELPALIIDLEKSKYKTAAMDTASEFQEIVLADMLGFDEVPTQWNPMAISEKWGRDTRSKYGERALAVKRILDGLLKLPQHVIITAHEMNFNEDEAHADLLFPSIGSALSKSTAGWLNGAVDYICQTFIREQTETTYQNINGQQIPIQNKTDKKEFCLRIGPDAIFQTGFRVPPGVKIPDVIVNPTYSKIQSVIDGTYKS